MTERQQVTMEQVNLALGLPHKFKVILAHLNDESVYPTYEAARWLLESDDRFARSVRQSLKSYGRLTSRQAQAVNNAAERTATLQIQNDERTKNAVVWPVESTPFQLVLKVRSSRVIYGSAAAVTPVVRGVCEVISPVERAGAVVWMTIPKVVREGLPNVNSPRGVVFSCRVRVSRASRKDDPHFGIGNRPSDAEFLRMEEL